MTTESNEPVYEDQAAAFARRAARDREWDEMQRKADLQARHHGKDGGAHHRPGSGKSEYSDLSEGRGPDGLLAWLEDRPEDPAQLAASRRSIGLMFEDLLQRTRTRVLTSRLPRAEFRDEPDVRFTYRERS